MVGSAADAGAYCQRCRDRPGCGSRRGCSSSWERRASQGRPDAVCVGPFRGAVELRRVAEIANRLQQLRVRGREGRLATCAIAQPQTQRIRIDGKVGLGYLQRTASRQAVAEGPMVAADRCDVAHQLGCRRDTPLVALGPILGRPRMRRAGNDARAIRERNPVAVLVMVHRRHGDNRARVAALVKDLIPNIQISHGAPSLRGRNRRIDREHLSLLLRDPDEGPAVAPPTIGPQFEEPPEQRFLPVLEDERLADPAALREAAVDLDELDDAPPVTEGHSRWLAVASRARAPVQGYDLDLQARVAAPRSAVARCGVTAQSSSGLAVLVGDRLAVRRCVQRAGQALERHPRRAVLDAQAEPAARVHAEHLLRALNLRK